jgi:PAS domain S-box-containing protein
LQRTGSSRGWWFALAIVSLCDVANAAPPVFSVSPNLSPTSLHGYVEYLEDPDHSLSLTDALNASAAGRFSRTSGRGMNFGYSDAAIWLKLEVANPDSLPGDFVIWLGAWQVDNIQAYLVRPDGRRARQQLGDRILPRDRAFPVREHAVEIALAPGESVVAMFRVASTSVLLLPIHIASKSRFHLEVLSTDYFVVAITGATGALLLLNLFFFLSMREASFFWYSACCAGMILYMLALGGRGPFIIPWHPLWQGNAPTVYGIATAATIPLFTRSFLNTRGWIDHLMKAEGIALFALTAMTLVFGAQRLGAVIVPATIVTMATLPIAAIMRAREGAISARYFLLAWSLLLVAVVSFTLSRFGIAVGFGTSNFFLQLAVLVERIGTGLGLAHRVYLIRTERTAAQEATADEQARYQQLVDNSPFGVIVVDRDLDITHVNSIFATIVGREDLEDATGLSPRNADEILTPEMVREMERCLEDARSAPLETTWVTPGQDLVRLRILTSPVLGPEGEVVGCQAFFEDITQEDSLRNQLNQAQKLAAVARLAGGVAHDFNNYLTAILGFTDMLLQKRDNTPDDALELIRDAAERSAGVARQLLAFSRKQAIQLQVFDLVPRITGMARLLDRMVGDDVTISIDARDPSLRVKMDPSQLEQVLANLVVNASDALHGGGSILIAVEAAPTDPKEIALSISDNGEGMSEATRLRIFDPFFTTKESGKGTGLGLATVMSIVQQNGGRIDVESAPGHGTSFHIILPRVEEALSEVESSPEPRPTASVRVLVVDDNTSIRRLVTRVLEDAGHVVHSAENGRHALDLIGRDGLSIDLLVSDVVMPEMNGVELRRHMAHDFPKLRVLYISGYTECKELEEIETSRERLLSKPFSSEQLEETVRDVLGD